MHGRLSRYALVALFAVTIAVRCSFPQRQVLTWDVFGYHLYLPAAFIHDDVALKDRLWLDEVMTNRPPSTTLYQVIDGPDGGRVIRYSSGMAVLFAPFFLIAHLLAEPAGFPADGSSAPYQFAATIGALAFALLGMFLLLKVLRHFFHDGLAAALLLLIGLGTNWFQLVAWDGTLLTHPALFTLYGALLLATITWHRKPTGSAALAVGVLTGFITLVRPSELVVVLVPVLWGIAPAAARAAKWQAIRNHPLHAALAVIGFIAAMAPQLVYWRITTGEWLFYSYANPGEGFDFDTPHIRPFLTSFRKGWLLYTPLMLPAIGGILLLRRELPQAFLAILAYLVLDLWIVSSWSCWWYAGGSFSSRSMVPAYVLLALPLGALLQRMWTKPLLRWGAGVLCAACVMLNLFQTWQWTAGIISKERMTRAYYMAVFGRTSAPGNAEELLLVGRATGGEEKLIHEHRYTGREAFRTGSNDKPGGVLTLSAEAPFSPAFEATFEQLTGKDHAWIRCSARFWVDDSVPAVPTMVVHFEHKGGTYKYMARDAVVPAATRNTWVTCTMDYLTPEVRSSKDKVKAYLWNQQGEAVKVDDFTVQVLEPE